MPIIAHGGAESKDEATTLPEAPKGLLGRIPEGFLTVAVVALASSGSFGLGYVAGQEGAEGPVRIEQGVAEASTEGVVAGVSSGPVAPKATVAKAGKTGTATEATGSYVASKKGTKYHLPTCSGAKTMSPENKIWFNTKEEAEAAGYTPAANCKGL